MKRKFIDDKGRFFGVVSAIDIIVALVLVALLAAMYTRYFTKPEISAAAAKGDTFSYDLSVRQVRYSTYESLAVGDTLYDNDNGTVLGVITDISYEPATTECQLMDGTFVLGPVENRYDVLLTVEADGIISADRYFASRIYEINVNAKIEFHTKYCNTSGYVWSIY